MEHDAEIVFSMKNPREAVVVCAMERPEGTELKKHREEHNRCVDRIKNVLDEQCAMDPSGPDMVELEAALQTEDEEERERIRRPEAPDRVDDA